MERDGFFLIENIQDEREGSRRLAESAMDKLIRAQTILAKDRQMFARSFQALERSKERLDRISNGD